MDTQWGQSNGGARDSDSVRCTVLRYVCIVYAVSSMCVYVCSVHVCLDKRTTFFFLNRTLNIT